MNRAIEFTIDGIDFKLLQKLFFFSLANLFGDWNFCTNKSSCRIWCPTKILRDRRFFLAVRFFPWFFGIGNEQILNQISQRILHIWRNETRWVSNGFWGLEKRNHNQNPITFYIAKLIVASTVQSSFFTHLTFRSPSQHNLKINQICPKFWANRAIRSHKKTCVGCGKQKKKQQRQMFQ